ncbi:MAG: hypothetical protein WAU88_09950, partial [Candidatus Zixiibacteriota bacterium]
MKRLLIKLAPTGFRCLVIAFVMVAIGFTMFGAAMGVNPMASPKKAEVRALPICEQLTAQQPKEEASGAMTPKQKPQSPPEISVVAPVITKTDSDNGRFNRNFTSDCTYHQVNQFRATVRTICATLSV